MQLLYALFAQMLTVATHSVNVVILLLYSAITTFAYMKEIVSTENTCGSR